MPYISPLLLSFGLYTNYLINLVEVCKGNDVVTPWKLLLPLEIAAMARAWGWRGLLLMYLSHAILGVYYFTMALMNHNAEHCHDVARRNAARDWGEAQLVCSADWSVGMPFWAAGVYLWLNYHTVHHLFPLTDMSHHPAMQRILIDTCEEFGIDYVVQSPVSIYLQMIRSFSSPRSLFQDIIIYGGGI
jgi:fatty acid desaturase